LKKGSKAAKAWGAKMRRLRGGGKKRRKSTRRGQVRKTARRAYTGLKRKARKSYKRKKSSSSMKLPKVPSVIKKVAIKECFKILQVCLAVVVLNPQRVVYNEYGTNSAFNG
jgi:hypothetical protein